MGRQPLPEPIPVSRCETLCYAWQAGAPASKVCLWATDVERFTYRMHELARPVSIKEGLS